ncbi:hypothetical protein B0O80DRAFT_432649 [Mortierella sp. GBAus27b]|nr:hypothetical protein B0O80DRAFT_432649 [Mortierella sp. GBAus27b]
MLKASDSGLPSGKIAKDSHGKHSGNTNNLLKATSKVLAFLNRKTNSSGGGIDNDSEKIPQHAMSESSSLPQANGSKRAPIHDTLNDSAIVDQYKHLFKNRPLNNQQSTQPQHQHASRHNNYKHSIRLSKYKKKHKSNPQKHGSPSQSRIQLHDDTDRMLYTEQEIALAQEQLRIVRRNLGKCSQDSTYFKRFAAMADDWRNFLPRRGISGSNVNSRHVRNSCDSSSSELSILEPQSHSLPAGLAAIETSSDYEPSLESQCDSEDESGTSLSASNQSLIMEADMYHHPNSITSSATSGATRCEQWPDVSNCNVNESHTSHRDEAAEETDANDADEGENSADSCDYSGPFCHSKAQKDYGIHSKESRRRSNRSGTKRNGSKSNGQRERVNDVRRPGGVLKGGERRTHRRRSSHSKLGFRYPSQSTSQHQSNYGNMTLENVLRQIEPEFSLCMDDSDGSESEDSLTCLVPGRRNHDSYDGAWEHASENGGKAPETPAVSYSHSESERRQHDQQICSDLPIHVLSLDGTMSIQDQRVVRSASAAALEDALRLSQEIKDEDTHSEDKAEVHQSSLKNLRPLLTLQTTSISGVAPGALSAIEKKPLGSQFSLTKCNSTSSLYIDSTMTKSDVEETLRAVSTILYDKVLESHRLHDCRTERIINSSSYVPSEKVMMTQADIFDFMRFIFDCGQNLGAENAIITLIYVERMTELGNLSFHAINWRRLLLGALVLSIKVWEDLAVFNSDVCAIFEGLHVKDVNALERFSMAKLQYNVSVKRSVYASYYFRLREISEQQYNEHYGKLMQSGVDASCSQTAMTKTDSCPRSRSSAGLMSIGMASNSSSSLSSAHHSKVPVGPGYRKWTLKPLSVREADRLEARSSLYASNLMMEAQERRDAGCCLDEYSCATPEELHNLSASLLSSSVHTTSSMASMSTTVSSATSHSHGTINNSTMSASSSASSTATKVPGSTVDLAANEGGTSGQNESTQGTVEPPRRTLRLKKSRSDFFFQNTTPVSIM